MSTNITIYHDLHQHSILSSCCHDQQMTPQRLLSNAIENGYDTICVTDHVWDRLVPGASNWYAPQTVEHLQQSLPLPTSDEVRFCFGCETEYCGGKKLGLAKSSFNLFDFIVIPVNHFHMLDFVRPSYINTPELVANLMLERLEELQQLDLPWEKIGIAHFTCNLTYKEGRLEEVFELMPNGRLLDIFRFFAKHGTGIELNAECFNPGWDQYYDILLRPYKLAREAGCKFYFASDAHSVGGLYIKDRIRPIVDALNLQVEDLYRIP